MKPLSIATDIAWQIAVREASAAGSQFIKKVTGTGKEPVFKKHNDLDGLAGGWSKKETA